MPSCAKNAAKSACALSSYGCVAKLAIFIGVLYFWQKVMFCIILPSSCALFCPVLFSIVENENPIAVFLSVASLHNTWFSPDLL